MIYSLLKFFWYEFMSFILLNTKYILKNVGNPTVADNQWLQNIFVCVQQEK